MDASAFEERLREETAYAERVLREHLPKEEGHVFSEKSSLV